MLEYIKPQASLQKQVDLTIHQLNDIKISVINVNFVSMKQKLLSSRQSMPFTDDDNSVAVIVMMIIAIQPNQQTVRRTVAMKEWKWKHLRWFCGGKNRLVCTT